MTRSLPFARLRAWARGRPPGYLEEVLSRATVEGETVLLPEEAYAALRAKYAGASQPPPHWGPPLWNLLHRTALEGGLGPAFLASFAARLPDGGCGCRRHWVELLRRNPPPSGREAAFAWTVARHNDISARLGKPSLDPDAARMLFKA